ncbi:MAG: hypothetical protein IJ381_04225 [Clostridia bacterium]|nr:hypothetical protein [Clostridia bacterium]
MIDEYFERIVDRLCIVVPRVVKPRVKLFSNSFIGWRLWLYIGTAGKKIAEAFGHISNEENMDLFMRETAERGDDSIARVKHFFTDTLLTLARLETSGQKIRFCAMLFMLMLSALGVAANASRSMAVMAASLCMMWLSSAIECDYRPISSGIRQQYLMATVTRTLAISMMLISYFFSYVEQGVPSNVVLQSAMIAALVVHGIVFMALVAFNTRQPFLLRLLAGVLGMAPALTLSAAIALAASSLFRPWPVPLAGVSAAVGALFAFMGDQLITVTNLGGIRLKYHSIWVSLLEIGGFALMLLGAWTYIL